MPTQPTRVHHPGLEERRARQALRKEVDPGSHAEWRPAAGRRDPVELLRSRTSPASPTSCRSTRTHDGVAVHVLPLARR